MYQTYFGLKRRPFGATPDSRCFLASRVIQAALDEIVVCVEQGQGIAVVSAPAGIGKTLLCERLRTELGNRFESVILRHANFLTRRGLLQTLLCELSHAYRQQDEQELRLELSPAIRALQPEREALVLICDEAHQLSRDLLEELRILSDFAENGRPLVRLVLVGQRELEETLAMPSLEALSQRIRAHVCLETMDRADSLDYIDYRLTWAGGRTEEIFDRDAVELICQAADGVPRCLNQLCDQALLLGFVAEQRPISTEIIREALQDLRQLPLHWNETSIVERPSQSIRHPETDVDFDDQRDWKSPSPRSTCEMESVEIGSDLPLSLGVSPEESLEAASSGIEIPVVVDFFSAGESRTESHAAPILSTDHLTHREGTPDVGHAPLRKESSSPSLLRGSDQLTYDFSDNSLGNSNGQRRCFVEELVLDRYASIDAGRDPVAPQTLLSVLSSIEFEHNESIPRNSKSVHDAANFRDVCDRLEGIVPPVSYETCWNDDRRQSTATAIEDSHETQKSRSGLGILPVEPKHGQPFNDLRSCSEVPQLADALDRLGHGSAPDPTRQPIGAAFDSALLFEEQIMETPSELGEMLVNDSGPTAFRETEPRAVAESVSLATGMARPYRNLFSQLRRKQRGLL